MWNPFADGAQGAVKGLGEAIKAGVSAFKADPTKVAELENTIQVALLQHESTMLQVINQTMQEEAKSEHWMQWAWRPTIGFTFAAVLINNYILVPYFRTLGMVPLDVPGEVWTAMLVVLGAAAAGRSWEKAK